MTVAMLIRCCTAANAGAKFGSFEVSTVPSGPYPMPPNVVVGDVACPTTQGRVAVVVGVTRATGVGVVVTWVAVELLRSPRPVMRLANNATSATVATTITTSVRRVGAR
jgi:hypothetical protein